MRGNDGKVVPEFERPALRLKREKVLVLHSSDDDIAAIEEFEMRRVGSLADFDLALKEFVPEAVVIDSRMGEANLQGVAGLLETNRMAMPVVILMDKEAPKGADESGGTSQKPGQFFADSSNFPNVLAEVVRSGRRQELIWSNSSDDILFPKESLTAFSDGEDREEAGFAILEADSSSPLYVSKAFCAITGYSVVDILSMSSIANIISSDDRDAFSEALVATPENEGGTIAVSTQILTRDGRKTRLQWSVKHFSWNRKRRVVVVVSEPGFSGMTSDKEELDWISPRTSVAGLSSGSGELGPADFILLETDESGKIRSASSGAERMLGVGQGMLLGRDVDSFIPIEGGARNVVSSFLSSSNAVEKLEMMSWLSIDDGDRLYGKITITRLPEMDGRPSGYSILVRNSGRQGTNQGLREREAQLRSLAAYLQKAWEEEKASIARQLHDEFGQILTAMRMDLSILGRMVAKTVSEPLGRLPLLEKISSNSDMLERAIRSARELITGLRPAVLDELGLFSAIQWQAVEFENRTGIKCHVERMDRGVSLDSNASTALFRVLQEALENVRRHADATEVSISLDEVGSDIVMLVSDNGKGIDRKKLKDPSSTGIIGMRERIASVNGNLNIRSEPGKGTALVVSIRRSL